MKETAKIFFLLSLFLFFYSAISPTVSPLPASAQEPVPVLAFYYAWFDQNTWISGQSVDLPAEYYTSADRTTIERHVAQAQSAGIDALVQSWYGPQVENNQTETNFRTLLDVAQNREFKAAVDFETTGPFFGDSGAVANALATLLATHVQHPAYLRFQGKPVIFFWRQQRFSVDEWLTIRAQVDPNHDTYWIAEGVDIAYQDIFDGHHLYSIAWADSPAGQQAKWGDRVRTYEAENQVDRLWVATTMPGYDDTRLPRNNAFSVPRRNGDYYRETWQGALASQPEMVIITSFNEWPEGTHIEPSAGYGNFYLDLTRELVTELRGAPPAAPASIQLAQQAQTTPAEKPKAQDPPPDGPYIQVDNLTNVRSGPATTFDIVGRIEAGSAISVVGRLETNDWWQIDFESGPEGKGWVSGEVVEFVGDTSTVAIVEAPKAAPAETNSATEDTNQTSDVVEQTTDTTPIVTAPDGGVNVRSGPGLDFDLLGLLEAGTTVPVVAKNDTEEWWQIEYLAAENGLGWVAGAVVDFSGDHNSVPLATSNTTNEANLTPPAETSIPEAVEPVIVGNIEAIDPINVRSEPSLEGVILGGLFPGETADVLALSQDGEWWQIDFVDSPDQPAWVAAEFVRFTGEKNRIPIFGVGTVTPTPGSTNTPTSTPTPTATPTITLEQPTYAPTATSAYQGTSAALIADRDRGTPDPSLTESDSNDSSSSFLWSSIPWGILAVVVVVGFIWYQFVQRRRRKST